jgi:hypothetical protein
MASTQAKNTANDSELKTICLPWHGSTERYFFIVVRAFRASVLELRRVVPPDFEKIDFGQRFAMPSSCGDSMQADIAAKKSGHKAGRGVWAIFGRRGAPDGDPRILQS